MEKSLEEQQFEALQTAYEYTGKLINGINMCIENIKENKQEEAINLLSYIIEGIEWLNEVVKLTKDIQADNMDKDKMKEKLEEIFKYVDEENYEKTLNVLQENILTMLNSWQEKIQKTISA